MALFCFPEMGFGLCCYIESIRLRFQHRIKALLGQKGKLIETSFDSLMLMLFFRSEKRVSWSPGTKSEGLTSIRQKKVGTLHAGFLATVKLD